MDFQTIQDSIRRKIIWLDYKPGSTFNMSELAKEFGVSRNPITLVLTRLEAEGWVVRHGSHFGVSPLSLDRIKESVEIRLVLEVQANIWAMNRITGAELLEMEKVSEKIAKLPSNCSMRELLDLDLKFHNAVFRAAKNAQVAEFLDRIVGNFLRFWQSIQFEVKPQGYFSETLEIIKAIKERDEAQLREATVRHIRRSYEGIIGTS